MKVTRWIEDRCETEMDEYEWMVKGENEWKRVLVEWSEWEVVKGEWIKAVVEMMWLLALE